MWCKAWRTCTASSTRGRYRSRTPGKFCREISKCPESENLFRLLLFSPLRHFHPTLLRLTEENHTEACSECAREIYRTAFQDRNRVRRRRVPACVLKRRRQNRGQGRHRRAGGSNH